METRQAVEKCIYDWRLDRGNVADVAAARTILPNLPPNTTITAMDTAYDAQDVYTLVEDHGAIPIIKPRCNARTTQLNARGRAIRERLRRPTRWQRRYNRRPITESVNYALKRRFGDRLWSRGIHRQRREMAFRILTYNTNMVHRATLRLTLTRRD